MPVTRSRKQRSMAGRKKESFNSGRVEFRAEPDWIERVTAAAKTLGLDLSSFCRMVITKEVKRIEAEERGDSQVAKG